MDNEKNKIAVSKAEKLQKEILEHLDMAGYCPGEAFAAIADLFVVMSANARMPLEPLLESVKKCYLEYQGGSENE